jgi:hypothetical protein
MVKSGDIGRERILHTNWELVATEEIDKDEIDERFEHCLEAAAT